MVVGVLGMACRFGWEEAKRPVAAAVWSQWVCRAPPFMDSSIPSM